MSGNLCRCGAYNGIVPRPLPRPSRERPHDPLHLRPRHRRGHALQLGSQPGAKYLGGGTNLVDLMRETIERPLALVDVTGSRATSRSAPTAAC
jgi:hypothetical protein